MSLVVGACGHRALERMVLRGQYEAVVSRVADRKRLPRGRSARAYAQALTELGHAEQARAVLLRDFRTSGDLASMVALADLEAERGELGIATAHYSRVGTLDSEALRGREDVCALLRRRARVYLADGEALAADQDIRRVALLCPKPADSAQGLGDAELAATIRVEAEKAARQLRTLKVCEDGPCAVGRAERAGLIEIALATARAKGPRALRAAARLLLVQVSAEDVVVLLGAELRGELGGALIANDEVRAWVGETSIEELAQATRAMGPGAEQAYVRLRLGRLGPGYSLPVAKDEPGSEAAQVTLTLEGLDERGPLAAALGWRVLALIGDLPGAEMTLVAGLRGAASRVAAPKTLASTDSSERDPGPAVVRPRGQALAGGALAPAQDVVPPPSYAAGRIQVGARSWRLMLVLARMRAAAGGEAQALEIIRYALAEAQARGFSGVEAFAQAEAHAALASGQPWRALAIADGVGGMDSVESAAAAAILLERAACPEGCGEREDRALARRVLGESWVLAQSSRLQPLAMARSFVDGRALGGCPGLRELLAEDALGTTAEGLQSARAPVSDSAERRLRRAIEADIGLVCAGRLATPVMVARGYRVGAGVLMQSLSQAPQMIAGSGLAMHAEIALAAGQEEQARSLYDAAAASSPDPLRIWERAAWIGQLADARELEMVALRRILLHTDAPARTRRAHRALVVRALRDANDAWAARSSEIGGEALGRAVVDYIDRYAKAERWWARENLARVLADEQWFDETAAALVRRAIWPEAELAQTHPAASRRLEWALRGELPLGRPDPLSPAELAIVPDPVSVESMPLTKLFSAEALVDLRLSRSRARLDREGRRLAVAMAVSGPAQARAEALRLLFTGLEAAGESEARRAVEELVLSDLPALSSGESELRPMLADPKTLIELIFDIDPRAHLKLARSE
ncbi:MAG TPA: hypothetical protein ENJ18_04660 [Nannocystis exedens]|nr:hypothetical protein [Nannocystis exedens]